MLLYLGVFVLAVAVGTRGNAAPLARRHRDRPRRRCSARTREPAVFGTRRRADLASLLPGVEGRLSYPVDYWNGLAILVGLAFPLLLELRDRRARPIAGAPLRSPDSSSRRRSSISTSSRGGAATAIVGIVLFLALTVRRLAALAAVGLRRRRLRGRGRDT